MKKIKRFILLAALAAMAAVASAAPPKQPIDVAFAQLAQTLIDMGAITNSEAQEYEGGYHKFYNFVIDKEQRKLVDDFEAKTMRPNVALAYMSNFRKAGTIAKSNNIGYGKDNALSYRLGVYIDRNYDILYLRDPLNKEKRYVYALVWWMSGKKMNGSLLKFYNIDPVVQREKASKQTEGRRVLRTESDSILMVDGSGKLVYSNLDIANKATKFTSSSLLTAVTSVCSAYTSLAFSDGAAKDVEYRQILANRLVTLCNLGRKTFDANDKKACIKQVEGVRRCEPDVVNSTLLDAALTLLKN